MTSKAPKSIDADRRAVLRATGIGIVAAGVQDLLPLRPAAAADEEAIRPFRMSIPKEQLSDLQRRLAPTRWPDRETVTDESQGAPLATMQNLIGYRGGDCD